MSHGLQVKDNFERFISCKSTIDDIHMRLRKAEGDYGDSADGASTADMVAAVTDVRPLLLPAIQRLLLALFPSAVQCCSETGSR